MRMILSFLVLAFYYSGCAAGNATRQESPIFIAEASLARAETALDRTYEVEELVDAALPLITDNEVKVFMAPLAAMAEGHRKTAERAVRRAAESLNRVRESENSRAQIRGLGLLSAKRERRMFNDQAASAAMSAVKAAEDAEQAASRANGIAESIEKTIATQDSP